MFSKLSTFRNKAIRSKKEKHKFDEDHHISKASKSYFPTLSTLKGKNDSEVPLSPLRFLHSNVSESHLTSPVSFGRFSSYEYDNESVTASSIISEEIGVSTYEFRSYEDAEEEFLQDHEGYFLHLAVDNVRKDQYPKLELQRLVYLDYATCPLYSQFQVEQHVKIVLEGSDPYLGLVSATSNSYSEKDTYVDITSKLLLNLFNTNQDDYTTIFTPGLASCYTLFTEMHQFQKGSILLVSPDSHESCKHVMHTAVSSGVKTGLVPIRKKDLCIHGSAMHELLLKRGWGSHGCGVLIYPAQSYFSGICHSLNWIPGAQQNGWKVLLDVTRCLPTVSVDLSLYQPEFVAGSLHHALGYPSDVGYLLVRRNSHSICTQKGSIQLKMAEVPDHGTSIHVVGESLSLHTFAALSFGLKHLQTIGMAAIRMRVDSLFAWLIQTLKSFKHKVAEKPLLQVGSIYCHSSIFYLFRCPLTTC
eukprot:TRINITY_DN10668_c0_g1_i2.p1 TRINITY_DN10668_c0_g1~~TRINITY_DN10668_c0_g1_i2.p1  ORF type:complete len:472 (+),score=68.04 TRINITY_DN10668_c0_g1_i2:60-1475(+)